MLEAGRDALPAAFEVEGDAVQPPTEPGGAELRRTGAATRARRRRRRAADAARPVRRGRHGAGPARAGRPAVRRLGRARLRGRHGQDHDEARVRRAPGSRSRRTSRCATATTSTRSSDRRRRELGLPVLREAGEHGLVGRRLEGARRPSSTRALGHALEYDEWIVAEEMVAGREIEVAVLGDDPPEASLPGEIVPAPSSTTTPTSTRTARPSCSRPRRSTTRRPTAVRALAVRRVRSVPVRGDGARRLLLRRQRLRRERAQHDPRLHADLDVPAAWEVVRPALLELLDRLIELAIDRHARRARRGGQQR